MANRFARFVEPAQAAPTANRFARFAQDAAQESPTLNARASGSSGAVNKKAEAIWGGSFDDWKKRKEADDAERARMVAESEAGNVGSRRAQDFQRETATLAETGALRNKPGEFNFGATGQMMRAGAERAIGGALRFAGESAAPVVGLMDAARNPEAFVRRTTDRGEIPSNAVLAAGQDNALANAGSELAATGATRARRAQPLLIDRPDDTLSVDGLKYYGQQAAISAPQLATTVAAGYLGGPAAALLTASGAAFGTKFADARDENQDFSQAARGALVTAANEAIPEMLPAAAALGKLSRFMPDWMADGIVSRLVATGVAESSTEGITEVANIAYETFGENKPMDRATFINRVKDAVITGGLAGSMVGAVTGTAEYAQARDEVRDDATLRSLRAAIKPRATTARILGPDATPDAAAGAQIADDAFRAAGVGAVAAADMAEQDALARDLDAAQLDQLGSEAEIDRLLTGNAPRERTDLYRASIPGAIPQGVHVSTNQDAFAAPGTIGGRDAPAPIQVTTLADRSVFVPGDPVAIRRKLADAGSQWQGMAQERDGIVGVRFSPTSWADVQGVVGGSVRSTVGNREVVDAARSASLAEYGGTPARDGEGAPRAYDASGLGSRAEPVGTSAPAVGIAGNAGGTTTQAAVAVDGRNLAGNEQRSIDRAPELPQPAVGTQGVPLRSEQGATDTGRVLEDAGRVSAEPSAPSPPALRDLTDDERNFWPALTAEIRESVDNPGGRMIVNNDGSVGRTKWADLGPVSGFWRDRPTASWTSDVVLTALDRASKGEKLSVQQKNIVEYAKGWARDYAAEHKAQMLVHEQESRDAQREDVRSDIESTLASVADTSPQQRASTQSLGGDYTAKLLQYKKDRRAWGLNPQQEQEYQDLLELDRETGKVGGRPMVGVRNKTAYVDALDAGELLPVQGFTDADDFKSLNDKLGHAAGDDAIREIGDALVAEFGEGNVFHRSGDEFLFQGADQAEVDAKMQRVRDRLSGITLQAEDASGNLREQQGIEISYGTGTDEASADAALVADKQRRKESGKRVGERRATDRRGVGSEPAGGGLRAGEDQGVAEGVGDELRNPDVERLGTGDAGAKSDSRSDERPRDSGRDVRSIESARTEQAEPGLTVAEFNAELAKAYDPRFPSRLARISIIAPTWRDVPQKYQDEVKADGADIRLVAGFVASDGTIVLIPGNMQRGEGVGVTIHEVGVHAWMAKNPAFRELLSDFKAARSRIPAVEAAFRRAESVADRDKNGNLTAAAKATLDEEAFAYYVEQNWNVKSPLMTRIKDAIARLLNRLGIPTSGITDALMRQALDGMVQAARESADAATRGAVTVRDGKIVYHKAWHGSPHDFDKFRLDDSTIGTGEGAQAFGHGLYFAGRKELGEYYRDTLTNRDPSGYALAHLNAKNVVARMGGDAEWAAEVISDQLSSTDESDPNHQRLTDTLAIIKSGEYAEPLKNAGRLYEVELAPTEDQYLDWDAPLSEQSSKVQQSVYNLLTDLGVSSTVANYYASSKSGADVYREISRLAGGDKAASTKLRSERVPGIRYLDGSSRGGKTGWRVKFKNGQYSGKVFDTKAEADAAVERGEYNMVDRVEKIDDLSHNFVIFDDSQVEVKAKYSRRAKFEPWKGTIEAGTVLYHGSPGELDLTRDDPLYLSDRKSDAGAYAVGLIPGTGKGQKGNPQIIKFIVSDDARVLDANIRINDAVMDMTEETADEAIDGAIAQAKREGYDFVWFEHPSVDGDEMNALIAVDWRNILLEDEGDFQRDYATKPKYSRRADGGPESLRVVTAGDVVDGRTVREGVPNQSSIASSLDDYTIIKGIREVPMDAFDKEYVDGIAEGRIDKRTQDLADAISASKEITPLIVAYDADGAYIIEGGHRLDALIKIGAKSLPAMVVIDEANPPKLASEGLGASGDTDARIAYSRRTPAEARAESAQKQADLGAQLVVSPGQSFVYVDQFTDDWRGQALKMRERIQDKLLSVRNVQKDIEQIRGAIEDAANVYRRENLMHGRVGDQRDKLQATHIKPLIEAMAEAKVSPSLLEDYLEARHAKERNEKIAAIKGGMPDGASGMTTAQAEDFLQGRAAGHRSGVTLDPAMTRQVSRLARKVDAITSETRRRLLDSGQITQDTFDALESAYAAYVPLRGKDGTESGKGRGTGKGIDVRGKPVLRAAGRGEGNRAQNILAEVIADAERSIINAEKLRVGRTLARLVLENPNPDVWEIEPVRTELKVSDGTPEEIYEAVKNLDQEEGTIIVKVKGKPYRIVFADNPGGKRMADAMKNMAVETVPEVIQYVAGLNRYFSAVLTRYNPSFVGVNMTRDLLFGMTGIWAEHGTGAALTAAKSYFPAMRAAWRDIQGKPPVNAMGRYAREFAEAGGKTYFGKLENVSDMSQRIGEEFKTFRQMAMPKMLGGESSPVRALAKVARDSKMVQAIEAVNDTVENTLRLSVYAARREAGASIEQAAEYAKNISVNFNRRGSATSWLNALYLFFNAATQGAHRTLTLLKNPKVQGVLGGLAALQATSAMFLMGLDDDDGEPLWDSISPWDKQRNLILAIPIKREKGWGATVIKIPMPYGFNLFPYMGGRSVELARDLQEKPVSRAIADYTTDAVVGVAQAMSPIPFDDGWKAALPHWVRIFTVLSENKDDLGIPIRAGDQYDSFDKPRSASGRDDTPLPFKIAATALNRLGGGDDYTPPYMKFALDWAPEDLSYLFKTFAGGLGSNVVKSGTLTEKLVAGVPINFKDVPMLSSFVSNVDQRQATSSRYYDHKDDIEREIARQRDIAKESGEVGDNPMGIKIARNKSGAKVRRGEGYELEGKPGSLFDTYKQSEKDISRIRDEMRAAFNDQSIGYNERIRKIDELKAEREEVQRELNAAWREQRKKQTR